MSGRPRRQEAKDLCERVEEARRRAGLSQAAIARELGTSSSNLSRSLKAAALSSDLAERTKILLERGWLSMRELPRDAVVNDRKSVQRALSLLRELSRMLPDLERALASDRPAVDVEDTS
jgi:transcriptional regulator with XRE-family HTH domain